MKYMLDTNTLIYARNESKEAARKRFTEHEGKDICISAITLAELEYGVANSQFIEQNRKAMMKFLSVVPVIPFDDMAARHYGEIRTYLKKNGIIIGANDMLIAAHAKSLNITLVSNNLKEFERVDGLKLENWVE